MKARREFCEECNAMMWVRERPIGFYCNRNHLVIEKLNHMHLNLPKIKKGLLEERGKRCECCGYAVFPKILELCHIIPKRKFGGDHPNNLFILCPNCHKAFDTGLISTETIKGFKQKKKKLL